MNQGQQLFGKRTPAVETLTDEASEKEAFIKGAATTNNRNAVAPIAVVESKPLTRLERLLAELEELVKEENQMWEETGKKPKTIMESFTKLPVVDKKLDIMFEDSKALFNSKSKFISFLIEERYESWKKSKDK